MQSNAVAYPRPSLMPQSSRRLKSLYTRRGEAGAVPQRCTLVHAVFLGCGLYHLTQAFALEHFTPS
jgi:hypothetical protein